MSSSADLTRLFEKIASGEIPSHKVYEDEHVFAFLDINPLSRGHTLLIPKQRSDAVADLPDETAAALGRALPRIARAIVRVTGATDYNILCNNGAAAGQLIPHVHFHIIPKYPNGDGLPHDWPARKIDESEAPRLRDSIAAAIDEER